jgi:hypothetical protein
LESSLTSKRTRKEEDSAEASPSKVALEMKKFSGGAFGAPVLAWRCEMGKRNDVLGGDGGNPRF